MHLPGCALNNCRGYQAPGDLPGGIYDFMGMNKSQYRSLSTINQKKKKGGIWEQADLFTSEPGMTVENHRLSLGRVPGDQHPAPVQPGTSWLTFNGSFSCISASTKKQAQVLADIYQFISITYHYLQNENPTLKTPEVLAGWGSHP